MTTMWQATLTCETCGKEEVQGPLKVGIMDALSIGHPPSGWLRFSIESSDKVLPKQAESMMAALTRHKIPQDMMDAQIEAMEMACGTFAVGFDICDACLKSPDTLGLLGEHVTRELQRQLEVAGAQLDKGNVVPLFDISAAHALFEKEGHKDEDED